MVINIFLEFTSSDDKKKIKIFEMYETLKNIMDYIDYYYILENKDLVIGYYKCLVNASRLKTNADYLIRNGLS